MILHHGAFRDDHGELFIKDVWGEFLAGLAERLALELLIFCPISAEPATRFQHYPISSSPLLRVAASPARAGGAAAAFRRELDELTAALIFLPTLRGIAAALTARRRGLPYVLYSGIGGGAWDDPALATRIRARVYRSAEPLAVRGAAGAIAAGAEVERAFQRRLPTFRTAPVTGVVNVRPVPAEQKERLVLFVGSLSERKGIGELAEAWQRLPAPIREGWRLTIAGDGALGDQIRSLAADRNDLDALGYVPHGPDLFALYERAAIVVLPSRSEGFPRVLLEGAAHGCALASTAVGGIAEAFDDPDHAPAWIAATDPASIAAALVPLLEGDWTAGADRALRWYRATFANRDRALEAAAFIATQIPDLAQPR